MKPIFKLFALILTCGAVFSSCENQADNSASARENATTPNDALATQTGASKPKKNGVISTYHKDGKTVLSEVTYKDGIMEGPQVIYYETGIKQMEGTYQEGRKHGSFTAYYETGERYRVTDFERGHLSGWDSVFYKSGNPKHVIPYRKGEVIPGTKEWDFMKKEHAAPKIVLQEINELETRNRFTFVAQFSGDAKAPKFWIANLGNGTLERPEYPFQLMDMTDSQKMIGSYEIQAEPGWNFVGKMVIKGVGHTTNNLPFVTYQVFPVVMR